MIVLFRKIRLRRGSELVSTTSGSLELVDVYEDKQITENLTSLCIQLTFQASNKTLLTKEVEHIINNIQTQLIQNFNVTIRV